MHEHLVSFDPPRHVDLTDGEAVAELGAHVTSLGPLSAACLSAGVSGGGAPMWEARPEAFEFVFDVNV